MPRRNGRSRHAHATAGAKQDDGKGALSMVDHHRWLSRYRYFLSTSIRMSAEVVSSRWRRLQ
jgi:hypothetical protein